MQSYFPKENSAAYTYADDSEAIIHLLVGRFIGENPQEPYILRAFNENSPACDAKARYHFDFDRRFPDVEEDSVCWAAGSLWCGKSRSTAFLVNCFGPVRIYLNGMQVFSSIGAQEGSGEENRFTASLNEGENVFILRCEKTLTGFGCTLANAMPQWEPCNFRSPFIEREGRVGFVFTEPFRCDPFDEALPAVSGSEAQTGVQWLPSIGSLLDTDEIISDGYYYMWTCLDISAPCNITLRLDANVSVRLWVGKTEVLSGYGEHEANINAGLGRLDILLCLKHEYGITGTLKAYSEDKELSFTLPADIKGAKGSAIFLGSFEANNSKPSDIMRFDRVYEGLNGKTYWRTQEKDVIIRPFAEAELYGRWTYPLGVTLYGLLRAGEKLNRDDYCQYVYGHVRQTTGIHEYALYDKEKYGFPGVNHQIAWLDALDDCGSFGSLMMECEIKQPTSAGGKLGDRIAEYITERQMRLSDGAFYRGSTMWADDMYMSVPFLIRYAKKTRKTEYIDEACRQLLQYRKHLCMEDCGLMSHIKSFRHDKANRIPWSRGNGWVFFSLSQLLTVLDSEHRLRSELVDFYNFLAEGYLRVQGVNGLWHQVLNDTESYEEASATAMFICSFARGIIDGYIQDELIGKAVASCGRAWKGITERAVDRHGNIYGVCRGSGFSFSRSYYRTLSWNFNDTHGVGIIILAGVEWLNLKEYLKQ